jgi:hypothetical protein
MPHTEPPADFKHAVHEALRLWLKDPALGSPLAHLRLVQQEGRGSNIRRATNQVLLTGLKTLAAEHEQDAALLRARFLDGAAITTVANQQNVAEATLYKMQRQAIDHLAAVIYAMECQTNQTTHSGLAARLPPGTADHLFGIDSHLRALTEVLLAPEAPWLVAIEGLGGIGKTALAHALVLRLAEQSRAFDDYGWVSAQQQTLQMGGTVQTVERPALTAEGLIEALLTQLTAGTGELAPLDAGRALDALATRLHRTPHLVVVDNLETVADVTALLPVLTRLANPSKFVLTSRLSFPEQPGIYHFSVPELVEADALNLIRHEARLYNLPHVAAASDTDLHPLYATVGGNPLALRLVTGQLHLLTLAQVVENLRLAQGKKAEALYRYIYWAAWQRLPPGSQETLALMPLFAQEGADLAAIQRISDLPDEDLCEALEWLVTLSLVNVSGDLAVRRYSIHRLTESFLLREVIKWQGKSQSR